MERRHFLRTALASSLIAPKLYGEQSRTPGTAPDASKLPRVNSPGELRGEMLYRALGRTGETVSVTGLGGSHIAQAKLSEAETTRLGADSPAVQKLAPELPG